MAPRVIALLAAYNEADVIHQVVGDLIAQGLSVYLIDHNSSDGTIEAASPHLDHGLLGIERFPEESGFPAELASCFAWEAILERKEQLGQQLAGDWFLHTDADELRESPFPEQTVAETIALVDRMGYNAVDFAVLNFIPTDDEFRPGMDLREHFRYFEPAQLFDRLQIKCWKKSPAVDLRSSGGHEARFAGRRVFPIRFLNRHYPIRSQAQGERKVFSERKPRFIEAERELGWHVQYDDIVAGTTFVRDPALLRAFDPLLTRRFVLDRALQTAELQSSLAKEREERTAFEQRSIILDARARLLEGDLATRTAAYEQRIRELESNLATRTEQYEQRIQELESNAQTRARSFEARSQELEASLASRTTWFEQRIHELESALEERTTSYEGRIGELDALLATRGVLYEERIRNLESELIGRDRAHAERRSDIVAEHLSRSGAYEQRIHELENDLAARTSNYEQRIRDLEGELSTRAANHERVVRDFENDLVTRDRAYADRLGELEAKLDSRSRAYDERIDGLEAELLRRDRSHAEQVRALETDLVTRSAAYEQRIRELESELAARDRSHAEQVRTLESDLDLRALAQTAAVEDLETKLDARARAYEERVRQVEEELQARTLVYEERCRILEAELAIRAQAVEDRQANVARLEAEVALATTRENAARISLESIRRITDDLRKDLELARGLAEDTRRDNEVAREQVAREREESNRIRRELLDLKQSRASERAEMQHQVAALTADVEGGRTRLHDAEVRIDELYSSRTWRWMAPGRLAWSMIRRG